MTDDWLRLASLLADDPDVAAAIGGAGAGADLRDVLVDALDDGGALAYMEWSDSGPELAEALAQLPRVFRAGIDPDEVGDVGGSLEDAIVRADALLAPQALRVLYLDEGSDACPLLVVAAADIPEIGDLAARVGLVVRVFG